MARLRILNANKQNIRLVTRNENNIDNNKIEEQKIVCKLIKKNKYKRENGICYSIPELIYGDYETRSKIKEILNIS